MDLEPSFSARPELLPSLSVPKVPLPRYRSIGLRISRPVRRSGWLLTRLTIAGLGVRADLVTVLVGLVTPVRKPRWYLRKSPTRKVAGLSSDGVPGCWRIGCLPLRMWAWDTVVLGQVKPSEFYCGTSDQLGLWAFTVLFSF